MNVNETGCSKYLVKWHIHFFPLNSSKFPTKFLLMSCKVISLFFHGYPKSQAHSNSHSFRIASCHNAQAWMGSYRKKTYQLLYIMDFSALGLVANSTKYYRSLDKGPSSCWCDHFPFTNSLTSHIGPLGPIQIGTVFQYFNL